jgi:thiol-disulfide isomerase/thioredoxin
VRADQWLYGATPGGLEDLKGEVVVLVFFGTWCKNCSTELPHIKRVIKRWDDKGVVFLGIINPDDPKSREPVEFYVNRNKIHFTDVALDRKESSWRPYHVTGLPAAVVVDRNGTIRWRGHFAFIGNTLLEKLLAE